MNTSLVTRIRGGRLVLSDSVQKKDIYLKDGKILAVTNEELPCDRTVDANGLYAAPGCIDMHTHGALDVDFSCGTPEDFARAVDYHLRHGTTSILPTVTASAPSTICAALDSLEKLMRSEITKANVLGAHLEGPYFSPRQAGAQDPAFITAPIEADYTFLTERYGSVIRRWSFAPERDTDGAFCRYLLSHGILPSAGHTDATYEEFRPIYEAGCRLITHLYSSTSTITRDHGFRRLGVIECAYLWDDMDVEIIADGCHLPPELIRLIVKLKGKDRVSLITDSLRVTGTPAKESSCGTTKCIVEDGVCKLLDRSGFAGSIATADRLIRVCVKQAGISLPDAVCMASTTPARVLGLNKGIIASGYDADLIIFDEDITVKSVIVGGEVVGEL